MRYISRVRRLCAALLAFSLLSLCLLPAAGADVLPPISINTTPVVKIELTKKPARTAYFLGEDIDVSGAELTLTHQDGKKEVYAVARSWCGDVDSTVSGTVTVFVDYPNRQGYTGTNPSFTVTYRAPAVDSLQITKEPLKTAYYSGEELETDGIEVTARYTNGVSRDVTNEITYSGYDAYTAGKQEVTASYAQDGKTYTATFSVTVTALGIVSAEIMQQPARIQYFEGESIDLTGTVIGLHYNDGTVVPVSTLSEITAEGYDPAVLGEQTVTLLCRGASVTLTVKNLISPVHRHTPGELRTVKQATCTEFGSGCSVCTVCGEIVETVVFEAIGHEPGAPVSLTPPTTEAEGAEHYVCSLCGEALTVTVPRLQAVLSCGIVTAMRTGEDGENVPFDGYTSLIAENAETDAAARFSAGRKRDVFGTEYDLEIIGVLTVSFVQNGETCVPSGAVFYGVTLPDGGEAQAVLLTADGKEILPADGENTARVRAEDGSDFVFAVALRHTVTPETEETTEPATQGGEGLGTPAKVFLAAVGAIVLAVTAIGVVTVIVRKRAKNIYR